ncbi:MAG: hypothetical protein LUG61_08900 [Lachnospiraceae bacterium]|nr:hypothetical protein [Lachnospiraceae bacterium]
MKFKEIDPGAVIHCPKEEDARALLEHLKELGYNIQDMHPRIEWKQELGEGIFYEIESNDFWSWGKKRMSYLQAGRKITEFSDLIEPDDCDEAIEKIKKAAYEFGEKMGRAIDRDTLDKLNKAFGASDEETEPPMSAEEVLGWLRDNGTTPEMVYLFGYQFYSCLLNDYTPEEIIDKITAYEAAKKAPKPVEVEWVDVCRIYDKDSGVYITEYEFKENEKILKTEEALRSYIEGRNGEYYAVIERRCRVKEDK